MTNRIETLLGAHLSPCSITMPVRYTELSARPQAAISGNPFHQWVLPNGQLWTLFFRNQNGYLLRFPDLADFEIDLSGTDVIGLPALGIATATVEHLYLNQVLPLALSRQNRLVLHGSAVDIQGMGVAFLGESGRGKSTLAASFATTGKQFLTDDGLQLHWTSDGCRIVPSHPSVRLWADSEDALMPAATPRSAAVSFTSKARFLAGRQVPFCNESRPLRRVFFLCNGNVDTPIIKPLRPAQAAAELVRNSFLLDVEAREQLARHFEDITRLAALPICFSLDYPRLYDALPEVRRTIMRHTLGHWTAADPNRS